MSAVHTSASPPRPPSFHRLRLQAEVLEEAGGLITELAERAISSIGCRAELAVLADANPDLGCLRGVHDDPEGERAHQVQELAEVRGLIDAQGAER